MTNTTDEWVRQEYGPAVDLLMRQALSAANFIDRLDRVDQLYRDHLTTKDLTIAAKDELIDELRRRIELAEQRALSRPTSNRVLPPEPPRALPPSAEPCESSQGIRRWWQIAKYGR